tara:strand:+ start:1329 stop:1829 length:501 start_codon:yes stop_codon:yes gene_type:complete
MRKNYKFLQKHKEEFITTYESLSGNKWSLSFPVFLFDRDWFRLKKITILDLAKELEPDKSKEAPEIIQYQNLLKEGHDHLLAIQECWNEFGIEDFHRSLRNSSKWETKGNNGWTFKKYLELLVKYRKIVENKEIRIPIIILGRSSEEDHLLEWMCLNFISELTIVD